MESLKNKIENDVKSAMKEKKTSVVSALRMVLAAIKNKEIDARGNGKLKQGESLDDSGVCSIISTLVKQRKESIEMFKQGGREDLMKKETEDLNIIISYLPSMMSAEEVEKIITDVIKESGSSGAKDMGKVMKLVMPKLAGRADGKLVNDIVREKLQ